MKNLKMLFSLLILLLLGFILFNIVAYNQAHAMMNYSQSGNGTVKPEALGIISKAKVLFLGINVPRPDNKDLAPSDLAPNCQRHSIATSNKLTLEAWYCDQGKDSPLIILFHGYGADKSSLLGEAKICLKMGASVLLVDFRGSGGSSAAYTTIGVHEADDVMAAVAYAKSQFTHSKTVLFGQSMGAVAILRAIDKQGLAPDALIIEAVFDTMLNTTCNRFKSMGLPAFSSPQVLLFWAGQQAHCNSFLNNPVDYAKAVKCPTLFMHGTDDPRATLSQGKRVFDAVPVTTKQLIEFLDVAHEPYAVRYPVEWKTAVSELIAL